MEWLSFCATTFDPFTGRTVYYDVLEKFVDNLFHFFNPVRTLSPSLMPKELNIDIVVHGSIYNFQHVFFSGAFDILSLNRSQMQFYACKRFERKTQQES